MPLHLAPLLRGEVARILHLELPEHQADFVAPIVEMVEEPDLMQDFHIALEGNTPVGFFKIDRDFSRRIERLPARAHALRGLLIGAQYQRHGLGHAVLAALKSYVAVRYDTPTLWLSVDESNLVAIALYQKHGWQVDGPPHRGRVGMEHVMMLPLR